MDIDLVGRIRNTKLSSQHALLPLFEAIVNSIHAIAELETQTDGKIEITVIRDRYDPIFPDLEIAKSVRSFTIEDNGVGFTKDNFTSFETADSSKKLTLGGKGVGRFAWLKAFDHAEIESCFFDPEYGWQLRSFDLRLTPKGVENHALSNLLDSQEPARRTQVRLCQAREGFGENIPRQLQAIASRIVEHCLQHFVLGLAPRMILIDSDSAEKIDLQNLYASEVRAETESTQFAVAGRDFKINHLRVRPAHQKDNRLYFCANRRAVRSEKLDSKVPNLLGPMNDQEDQQFVYAGYVSSDYLDEVVNTERTEFLIPDSPTLVSELTWKDLLNAVSEQSSKFLAPYTEPMKIQKEERIRTFVQTKAPHYRPLLKHKAGILDSLSPNLSEEKLDLELYRLNQDYETELKEQSAKLLESIEHGESENVRKGYEHFLEEWNESGMAKLAKHVAHRKATLQLLKASLSLTDKGKYEIESTIHGLIFPLRKTSDDVRAEQMNLWIIDEKLAYHFYLASDLPFRDLKSDIMAAESTDRPDLLIFNRPAAFVDQAPPFSSVVIVEFKRPARNDYTDDENPISQIYKYVNTIKKGTARDRGGRPISVPEQTPYYAYIVADLTETLRSQAQHANLTPSPDNLGFFGFNAQVGVYIEIVSFDKLLSDAERRNATFFQHLGVI